MTETKTQIIFGINAVLEKLRAAPHDVLEVIVAAGAQRTAVSRVEAEARSRAVRIRVAPVAVLDRFSGGQRHQGVIARVAPYSYCSFTDLLRDVGKSDGRHRLLILDGITDPRNFGALLRSAEAVGLRGVIIPRDRSVEVTAVVAKASAGAVHHLSICRVTNLHRALRELKDHNYWLAGLDGSASESIYDRQYPDRLGIVLGSEGAGIRPLILRECDYRVSIPMLGRVSSLNVAVAGAVFLYELLRQDRSH
jgi:23S rRNA (guanosine2251-2'-O)-methyltransferase